MSAWFGWRRHSGGRCGGVGQWRQAASGEAVGASVRECACGGVARLVTARLVSRRWRVTRVVSYSSLRSDRCTSRRTPATVQASALTLSSVEVAPAPRTAVAVLSGFTSSREIDGRVKHIDDSRDTTEPCFGGACCNSGEPVGCRVPVTVKS